MGWNPIEDLVEDVEEFFDDPIKELEDFAGNIIEEGIKGATLGLGEDLGEDIGDFVRDYGVEMAAIYFAGPAIISGVGGLSGWQQAYIGLQALSAGGGYLASKEEAKMIEENARRMAAFERDKASQKVEEEKIRATEQFGENLLQATATGSTLSGRSFTSDTGLGSTLLQNRKRSIDLARRISERGEKAAQQQIDVGRGKAKAKRRAAGFKLGTDIIGGATSTYLIGK